MEVYLQTRRPLLVESSGLFETLQATWPRDISEEAGTTAELRKMLVSLYAGEEDRTQINRYIQRFEVRKRLFAEYDPKTHKPVERSGYENIHNYILLAAIAEKSYCRFHSLKYLSCLLKLNDTLLSLVPGMEKRLLPLVKILVSRETGHVIELASRKHLLLKEA